MTVRSLVLLVVVGFAFSLVVPTVRAFLAQRADVAALERDVAQARERNDFLTAELERWEDPAFVAAQARERLAFVLPGEVAYRVVDPEVVQIAPEAEGAPEPETPSSGILVPASDVPWFESIWESVKDAGGDGPGVDATTTDEGTADDGAEPDAADDDTDDDAADGAPEPQEGA